MSRVGKRPVAIASGVTANVEGQTVKMKGPKGALHFVVHDDVSVELKDGAIREFTITPEDAGLARHDFTEIVGGDAAHNAAAARAILGGAKNGYRDAVLLNAAAALLVAGRAGDLREGAAMAAESIDSGAASARLAALAKAVPL